jgi:glycosyltransferase involved in cell wall biosynthesis
MDATVVITTKDRKDDLRAAVASALKQTGAAIEVLVVDDGSTDGTSDMIREEFPAVRLHREERSQGYIVQRNKAATLAKGAVIFSIDDDAAFSSPHVVAQTLAEFTDERIGAVAIPFADVNKSPVVHQRAPGDDDVYVANTFIGTAHALRRDLFLKLGLYRTQLFHQGEEMDYAIRMLDAGYYIRLGSADPVHHYESPRRDITRMSLFGRRNDVLFAWHNAPHPLVYILGTTINGMKHGLKLGRPLLMARGLWRGYMACFSERRQPVKPDTWRLYRRMKHQGPVRLSSL